MMSPSTSLLRTRVVASTSSKLARRTLRTSPVVSDRVAPPHPISHMRPIIYDDAPGASPPTLLRHPYSLNEFQEPNRRAMDLELQFKLQRQQLDAFHQNFWLDTNIRYYAAKESALASLPDTATPLDRENATSEFLTHWYIQEKERTDAYTAEWRKRNLRLIRLGAKVELQKIGFRVGQFFGSSNASLGRGQGRSSTDSGSSSSSSPSS